MEKPHTKRRRSDQSSGRPRDTLSNKMQRNLLFDDRRDIGDATLAKPPAGCQPGVSAMPVRRRHRGTRRKKCALRGTFVAAVASPGDDAQPRAGRRRISIALCHAVNATAAQIGPYVASCATLSVSPSSSSDTATSSTGST